MLFPCQKHQTASESLNALVLKSLISPRQGLVYKRQDIGHIYNFCALLKYVNGHTKRPHSAVAGQSQTAGAKLCPAVDWLRDRRRGPVTH